MYWHPRSAAFFAAPSVREALGAERTKAAGGGLRGSNNRQAPHEHALPTPSEPHGL